MNNNFYKGYIESEKRIDYIKYGLLNDFVNDRGVVESYNEDKITKIK